jgi:1,4-alpha-glucan branching enzyme
MAMNIPDYWIKIIKEKKDQDWPIQGIWWETTNRRADERTVSYTESHDQALVGDKTIIFRLIDSEMYWHMMVGDSNMTVDRGIALHKMIRLVTASSINGAYLNFMGNEFGHPEWIDFPREGNGWSHHYARRQWSLCDDELLKYRFLNNFDKAMIQLIKEHGIFDFQPFAIVQNIPDQVLVFKRGDLVFVFNFTPEKSFTEYGFQIDEGSYQILLCSDDAQFGGEGRVDTSLEYFTNREKGKALLRLYIPNRVGMVLKKLQ